MDQQVRDAARRLAVGMMTGETTGQVRDLVFAAEKCRAFRARDGAPCVGRGLHPYQDHRTGLPDDHGGDAFAYPGGK